MKYLVLALPLLAIVLPVILYHTGEKTKKRGIRALLGNVIGFAATFIIASVFIFSTTAQATSQTTAVVASADQFSVAAGLIGAGLAIGLACIGTGVAVGSAASAAIGAISENEKIFGKALVFVAMAEGIGIYGLLIAFMVLNKV